jgi:aspartyl-tRNA synthetase
MAFATEYRTHTCGDLKAKDVGKTVKLAGWVQNIRDIGGLIFVALRDHYGVTQIIFDAALNNEVFKLAESLKPESVIFIEGEVISRIQGNINKEMKTGEIEVQATNLEIDYLVPELPFTITDEVSCSEEIRLKYRFLDLRREKLHKNIILRSKVMSEVRRHMIAAGFNEIHTPILTVSSPEGARDYLVPSRLHPGKFYALPQAPQQYKQLLMCSGFDKYFQIAPCFRDEAARAGRSPGEFYQIDIEMAYVGQEDVFKAMEALFKDISPKVAPKKKMLLTKDGRFPRIEYWDALNEYGVDKPDIRYELKIKDVTEIFMDSEFKVFASNTKKGHCVKALVVEGCEHEARSFFDKMDVYAKEQGAKGLAYLNYKEDGLKGPIAKFLKETELENLKTRLGLKIGDGVFFGAGKWLETCKIMGAVRSKIAELKDLVKDKDELAFCWIVDFPLFEWNEEEGKVDFSHNPFSMPQGGMEELESKDPLDIKAYQYDLVCNGLELSSGGIRNHNPAIMYKAFEIAGYSKKDVDEKFGHMIRAFKFGAPPHGGIAPGLDRLLMIYADEPSIREVIAFPMNQRAQELMTNSPGDVAAQQLKELHLKIDVNK